MSMMMMEEARDVGFYLNDQLDGGRIGAGKKRARCLLPATSMHFNMESFKLNLLAPQP